MSDKIDSGHAQQMLGLLEDLFPLHRSMTGEGLRATLKRIQSEIPLTIAEVPSGTKVFDWTVPQEWSIRDAFIANASGERLVDYKHSNLHVVNGSVGVDEQMAWQDLAPKVHYLPQMPEAIPYRTAYFGEDWGFCVTESTYQQLSRQSDRLHVKIDAQYFDGSMSIGECVVPGESEQTVLVYCHTCHPSLANDNLSGIVVATQLAKALIGRRNRLSYRFVFAPATIGAITWLARNEHFVASISHGLVLSLLGNDAPFTYKKSRQGDVEIDSIACQAVSACGGSVREFTPFGYDERQFCSPGFNLPVGCLTRAPYGEFAEYHTSADNLSFVSGARLVESFEICESILSKIETQHTTQSVDSKCDEAEADSDKFHQAVIPIRVCQKCEPFLRRHQLHRRFGELGCDSRLQLAIMWVLNFSDGQHSTVEIASRSQLPESDILKAVNILAEVNILQPIKTLQVL